MVKLGILALQGAVQPHIEKLNSLNAQKPDLQIKIQEVRLPHELEGLAGIILPGGESTAMIRLLHKNALWNDLKKFVHTRPSWGICAGAILLAKQVNCPQQESLEAIDITVDRNAFGRQKESFEDTITPTSEWPTPKGPDSQNLKGIFIRAPRIRTLGPSVKTLFKWHEEPVVVQSGQTLISTFHPELTESSTIHEYFISICVKSL